MSTDDVAVDLDLCINHTATCRGFGKRYCADCSEHADPKPEIKHAAGTSIDVVDRIFGAIDFGIPG